MAADEAALATAATAGLEVENKPVLKYFTPPIRQPAEGVFWRPRDNLL